MIEEDPINETKPQPEKSDISSETIMCDQTLESKLEHTNEKDLEDVKRDIEEDVTLAPKNQIEGAENQTEKTKNVILTDEVNLKWKLQNSTKIFLFTRQSTTSAYISMLYGLSRFL